MTIQELVNALNPEEIQVQRMDASIVGAQSKKNGVTILNIEVLSSTFCLNDLLAIVSGERPRMHGLILWMPAARVDEILKA